MEQRELRPGGPGEPGALLGWGLGGLYTRNLSEAGGNGCLSYRGFLCCFAFPCMWRRLIATKQNNHILERQVLLLFCLHLNGHFQNRGKEGG